ncbi:MAG TPA: hypothetical protein DD979_17830 [Gammaproteobacteria bacterium]|nr:hypothetical protein [Gammaproteobacteria bacterium]
MATSTIGLVEPESIAEQLSTGGAISLRISASEPLSAHMFGVSMTERLTQIEHVCESARDIGVQVRIYLHAAFSCPYAGPTQAQAVAGLAAKLLRLGGGEFFLLDDCATATPDNVRYRVEVLTTQVARGRMGFLANANNLDTDALINQAASMGIKKFAGAVLPGLSLPNISTPYTAITLAQLIEILASHSLHNQDS